MQALLLSLACLWWGQNDMFAASGTGPVEVSSRSVDGCHGHKACLWEAKVWLTSQQNGKLWDLQDRALKAVEKNAKNMGSKIHNFSTM